MYDNAMVTTNSTHQYLAEGNKPTTRVLALLLLLFGPSLTGLKRACLTVSVERIKGGGVRTRTRIRVQPTSSGSK